jgi:pyruvate dehydrogenase E2 component (dihydrolipoamide acetyltransferase)
VATIKIPDIGGESAEIVEILVKPGDVVAVDDSLITLEGDKSTMDVPASEAGTVESIAVKVGDKVLEGDTILMLAGAAPAAVKTADEVAVAQTPALGTQEQDLIVPDLGDAGGAEVVEVLVKVGDVLNAEDSLITLEGDKATMDVPTPFAGKIVSLNIAVGDKVAQGTKIGTIASSDTAAVLKSAPKAAPATSKPQPAAAAKEESSTFGTDVHAGPAVRRIATEFGVNLKKIKATGEKSRITKQDIQQYVKSQLKVAESGGGGGSGFSFPKMPAVDFSKYGSTHIEPLSKIKRISGANLHRNWVSIPHITQFEESDITEMEAFRQEQKEIAKAQGIKLTPLVFIMKAVVATLKEFPNFNASLDESGENLIVKDYFHIGVAVDTPNGLVVPVIRDVDRKGIYDLAKELAQISKKAREKGLSMAEMQGGCFTISSLGGIGGTAFTPIINAPEVAILGVSRSQTKPIHLKAENKFVPRLMLPLSLSYDHRVIDGADGARFIVSLATRLGDIRKILL